MSIKVVTDSTCDLPAEMAAQWDITIVPAYINIGDASYQDGVELTKENFYQELPGYDAHPTTAAPAAGAFTVVYNQLQEAGADCILSIHIDSELSGILNAARLGAEMADVEVTLIDSRQLTMGLGFQALAAAQMADAGSDISDIIQRLDYVRPRLHTYAALDSLTYLRRSGRVNWAAFGVGSLLSVKPILHVWQGEIVTERMRTWRRARQFLMDRLAENAPVEKLAVLHTANLAEATQIQADTLPFYGGESPPTIVEITPAIGVHVGPGGLGLVFMTGE